MSTNVKAAIIWLAFCVPVCSAMYWFGRQHIKRMNSQYEEWRREYQHMLKKMKDI